MKVRLFTVIWRDTVIFKKKHLTNVTFAKLPYITTLTATNKAKSSVKNLKKRNSKKLFGPDPRHATVHEHTHQHEVPLIIIYQSIFLTHCKIVVWGGAQSNISKWFWVVGILAIYINHVISLFLIKPEVYRIPFSLYKPHKISYLFVTLNKIKFNDSCTEKRLEYTVKSKLLLIEQLCFKKTKRLI